MVTVAITGSLPRKEHNPAVPISLAEQLESTHEAFEAGATVVHVHVRKGDGTPTSDPDRFAAFQEGIRRLCPGIVVQFSTGGRSGSGAAERGGMLALGPDMASLTPGSVNFPAIVYQNPPDLVRVLADSMRRHRVKPELEIFDLSMIHAAEALVAEGALDPPLHVQFVLGVQWALPARRHLLRFLVEELGRVLPGSTWAAAGIGRHQHEVCGWALELGGHVRTGLEDNIRLDRHTLAPSNAALVRRATGLAAAAGRPVATPAETRRMLGLDPGPGAA